MEKIRSGQSFLYRKEGLNCTVIDVRLKRYSTTKDKTPKTARRQSERFRIK